MVGRTWPHVQPVFPYGQRFVKRRAADSAAEPKSRGEGRNGRVGPGDVAREMFHPIVDGVSPIDLRRASN